MKAPIPMLLKIPLLLGLTGLLAGILRFVMQGTSTVYTSFSRTFYVDDPALGWVSTDQAWVWVGLEVLVISALVVGGTFVMMVLSRRDARWAPWARKLAYVGAAVCLLTPIVPLYAFASGSPPDGARILLPDEPSAAVAGRGKLQVAPGRWEVVAGAKHLVVASISAGQETFDGQFSDVSGHVTVAEDLLASTVAISVDAGSIKTGVELRDKHAAADFKPKEHPRVSVELKGLKTLSSDGAFEALATITMAGQPVEVPVTGTLRLVEEQLVVDGKMEVELSKTPLDVTAFDKPTIGVTIRVILARPK